MPLREGRLYRGIVKEVMENACMVEFEDGTYEKAVIVFPYYNVETRFTEDTFGHGIIYKPAIYSQCICALVGMDLHIVGFYPPINTDKLVTQEIVSGAEDLDEPIKGADGLISEYRKNNQINQEQSVGHEDDYGYNDEEKTHGDMGFVGADGNKIMAYSFGMNVIMASNFCFRLYSKLNHTMREGFKNFYRYSPNLTETILNDIEDGSKISRKIKADFRDEYNFITETIKTDDGFIRKYIVDPDDAETSRTVTVDLNANFNCIHKVSGQDVYNESVGENADGRKIEAKNHTINTDLENRLASKTNTNVTSKNVVILSGQSIASIQSKTKVEIGSGTIVHINPPQMEPSPSSPANGNQTQTAGEMKPKDVVGKADEYEKQAGKTAKDVRADKVKSAITESAAVYGPKVIEKTGGTLPDETKVKTSAASKISDKVNEVAPDLPDDMKSKIVAGATEHLNKIDATPGQFANLALNTVAKAASDIINDQPSDDVLASVASTASDTFGKDNIEFKSGTMEDMMVNDAGPYGKGVISNSTTESVDPSDPSSPSVMEDKIADNIARDAVSQFVSSEKVNKGLAVYGSRGLV